MGSSPAVSVALCTYNGERFLDEQIRSILQQSVPPSQLVVSDDASSDGTLQLVHSIVENFLRDNPTVVLDFIVLKNSKPLGVTKNFEQAVRACSGDLIALSDQDDRWRVDRLERMSEVFVQRPELTLLHSDARLVDIDGRPLGYSLMEALQVSPSEALEIHSGNAFQALLRRNLATGATIVFRKGLLNHAVPFFEPWVHDEWLAILASVVGQVDFLPTQLIDYRQHETNQIGATKLTLQNKVSKLLEPRDERNNHLVARAESLLGRLIGLGDVVAPQYIELVRAKLDHDRRRRDLPVPFIRRLVPVLKAAVAGDYSRFSNGSADVLRDLVQPDR